jgi:subtilisin family serine protease
MMGLMFAVGSANAATKRYLVGFKANASKETREKVLKALGGRNLAQIKSNGHTDDEFEALLVETSKTMPAPKPNSFQNDIFATGAKADDGVIIEEDYTTNWIKGVSFQGTAFPTVGGIMGSLPKVQRGFANGAPRPLAFNEFTWGVKRVKAAGAWGTTKGKGQTGPVKVAVIDTGIKTGHKDLQGQVVGGYDAINDTEKDGSFEDDNGHGTHVAGTIGAKYDGKGVVGVAPEVQLYGVKVLDANGSGSLSDVVRGIIWATNNNIQVANMSLGTSQPSEIMARAVRYAKARGMVIVAAAGNSGPGENGESSVGYPAAYPQTIAIGASDSDDKVAPFSSTGPEVDFIAPGVDIVSSWPNGDYVSLSGTSMAAPHVTGLAALAIANGARGLGGPDGVMAALSKAASSIGLEANQQGAGMISAPKILEP